MDDDEQGVEFVEAIARLDKTNKMLLWMTMIIAALAAAAIVVSLLPRKAVKAQVRVNYDRQFEWVFR